MFELGEEMKNVVNQKVQEAFGMSYDEYSKLPFDEQQALMKAYHKKKKTKKSNMVRVMIGTGEDAMFINIKRGKKVMLFDGTIVEVGITPEESQRRLEERFNKIVEESSTTKQKVLSIFRKK